MTVFLRNSRGSMRFFGTVLAFLKEEIEVNQLFREFRNGNFNFGLSIDSWTRESGQKNPNSRIKAAKKINSVKYHFQTSLTNSLIFLFGYFHFSRSHCNLVIIT